MNSSIGQNSLDELLDAYCEASEEPNREILAEWIARYPQFERELIDFTMAWIQSEELPELADNQQDKEAGLQAGLRIAQQIYEKMGTDGPVQKSPSRPKLVSLILDGSLPGWPTDDFAQRINLSVAILRKLESRLITVATIPGNLIERISAALQRAPSEVIAYLEQEPVIQRDLRYKSKQSPSIGRQQNFFDAVRNDGELSDEQRTYWLSFEGRTR